MNEQDVLDTIPNPLQLVKAFAVHAPIGVQIYNAAGYSIYVNDQHKRIFGAAPPPGMCVLTDEHVKAAGWLHLIHKTFGGEPAMLPLLWYDPRDLKELSPEDVAYVQKYGKRAAIETHMVPVFDRDGKVTYVLFLFKDVTAEQYMLQESQRAFKERDDAKTLIHSVLDKTQAVVYIKDPDGKFIFANGQFCRIFGKELDQVLGKGDYDLFPEGIADSFRKNDLHVQLTRSHSENEEIAVHSDGTQHTYLSLKFPLDDSTGKFMGVCGISTDITQYRLLERELSTAKRMEAVGLLAGGTAHDFNNILGIILLVADSLLMKEEVKTSDVKVAMGSIKNAALRAALLTRQLLAFGRQQKFQRILLDVGAVVSGMKNMLSNALGEDIHFSTEIDPALWSVRADPLQLEQVLANLCLNARDAMPRGGKLTITVHNAKLSSPPGEFVELIVSDSGSGMSPEVLSQIFEPFFTTKKEGQGTGLGLPTVRSIVRGAGGDISVESVPGKGSSFRVYLPREDGLVSLNRTDGSDEKETYQGTETVLLVEDQGGLREVTASLLREYGYKVMEAGDGKAALDHWAKVGGNVDLVMTDVIMPGLSGVEMVQKMSASYVLKKVLFVSGYSEKKLSEQSFDQAGFHFIEKPYTARELFRKLREILETP